LEDHGLAVLEQQRQVLAERDAASLLERDHLGAHLLAHFLVLHQVLDVGEDESFHSSSFNPYASRSSVIGWAGRWPRTCSICSADIVQSVAYVSGAADSISATAFRAYFRLSW